ncbi:radical SAM protein [Candidatus Micrarchaeota archaeon]|nr:radical SAM protein [Candidatus Micrarchaeota archaeon]
MKRVLLLNPPSNGLVLRDYACSDSSKANYYWPPIDLLVLSGILSKDFEVHVLDAVVMRYSEEHVLKRIQVIQPDIIVSLIASVTFNEDERFLGKLKSLLGCKIFVTGDIACFEPSKTMARLPFLDGIILDFTSNEVINLLNGLDCLDCYYKTGSKIVYAGRSNEKNFSYPTPLHELFPLSNYSLPYSRSRSVTTLLVNNYGCPYSCSFCASCTLGFKVRDSDNVLAELRYIKSIGVNEVFFRDFTFTAPPARAKAICKKIIYSGINLSWSCEGRFDNIDEEFIQLASKAGCFLIFFGVESGDRMQIKNVRKGINLDEIKSKIYLCRKYGIKTLCSFILGLPGDNADTMRRTIDYALDIDCDYASFNAYVPRIGSALGKSEICDIDFDALSQLDPSKSSNKEVEKFLRVANKRFYLRPSYLLKQLSKLKSPWEAVNLVKNGLRIFKLYNA